MVTTLPAAGLVVDAVTVTFVAVEAMDVIGLLEPVKPTGVVVVAVIVWLLTVVAVLKVIVAAPVASIVAGLAPVNVPPFVIVNVTAVPDVATGLLLTSASCARTVTYVPATGVELFAVTRYFAAAPAVNETIPVVLTATALTVAVTVAVPAVGDDVSVAV